MHGGEMFKSGGFQLIEGRGKKMVGGFRKAPPLVANEVSKVTYNDECVLRWLYKARDGGKMGYFWPTVVREDFLTKGGWRLIFLVKKW